MARGRRSPVCRYCWGSGHTTRTCPQVKADANSGKSWAKDIVDRNKQAVANRACSYCGELKHTTRSCPTKINDSAVYEKLCNEYRVYVNNDLKRKGFQVGSLVRIRPYRYDSSESTTICYVEKVIVERANPNHNWFAKYKLNNQLFDITTVANAQAEYDQFTRYVSKQYKTRQQRDNLSSGRVGFRSVTGGGLGYWGDDGYETVEVCDFLHDYCHSSNRERYSPIV